jgi:hypothetical protein
VSSFAAHCATAVTTPHEVAVKLVTQLHATYSSSQIFHHENVYHVLLNASAHVNVCSTSYVNASSNASHVPSHASYTNVYVIGFHCA